VRPEGLSDDAGHGTPPHGEEQPEVADAAKGDQHEGGIGPGDEQVDARMVEDSEDVLGPRLGQAVIHGGSEELQEQGDGVDEGGRQSPPITGPRCLDDEQHQGSHAHAGTETVDHTAGYLLAQRIAAPGADIQRFIGQTPLLLGMTGFKKR